MNKIKKTSLGSTLVCSLLVAACATTPARPTQAQRDEVVAVVQRYGKALNASDTETIASLYTADAVFMPQHIPAAVGIQNVTAAYRNILGIIRLDIEFAIDEVHVVGDWAWVRTRSTGTVTILESGANHQEGNQELFLLRRAPQEKWKIARYIFTSTMPRSGS